MAYKIFFKPFGERGGYLIKEVTAENRHKAEQTVKQQYPKSCRVATFFIKEELRWN